MSPGNLGLFPIRMGCERWWLPRRLFEPHRDRAMLNHGQSLEALAALGGLSPLEALRVLEDRSRFPISLDPLSLEPEFKTIDRLMRLVVSRWDLDKRDLSKRALP